MTFPIRNPASVAAVHSADSGSRQKCTGWAPRWHTPDVGFQGGLEVGAAFAQPVHHRMLGRYHSCPAGPQDTAELGECGRTVAGIMDGQRADDEVKGVIWVGQRLPSAAWSIRTPPCRLLPGQAHHDRARIKGGDLGPLFQQFTQVKALGLAGLRPGPAGRRPAQARPAPLAGRSARWPHCPPHAAGSSRPSCRRHPTGPHPRTHNGTRRQRWPAETALPPDGQQASLAMPPPARYAATERKPDEPRHGGTQAAARRLSRSAALPAVHARGCIAKQASGKSDRMVDDTARDRAIYHALKAADESLRHFRHTSSRSTGLTRIAPLRRAPLPTRSSSCGRPASDWVKGCGPSRPVTLPSPTRSPCATTDIREEVERSISRSAANECTENASYAARKSGLRCRVTVLGIVHACTGKFPF